MAAEFCKVCKMGTRKKCASCPKTRKTFKVDSSSAMTDHPTTRFMGQLYYREDYVERLQRIEKLARAESVIHDLIEKVESNDICQCELCDEFRDKP